jgi:hypothetical protein
MGSNSCAASVIRLSYFRLTHDRTFETGLLSPLWVTCGRHRGKSFFDVAAALVGCGHVSGLLMRRMWPLALMLCADRVPIVSAHFRAVR